MAIDVVTPPAEATPSPRRLPYYPGLDGLRAIAVIAVLLYHAGLPVRGGFLGVESFFVLSGFLITGLLIGEWEQARQISLRSFWLQRARRLLPALVVMLAGTLLYAAIHLRNSFSSLWGDALAALTYVMNWHLINGGQPYFDPLLRPSLFQHLWSLAIEEQFYLVWPLVFIIGIRLLRRTGLLVVSMAGCLASVALTVHLYHPGTDPSRIYYGTDTRAAGLLLGVALAIGQAGAKPLFTLDRWGRWLDWAGLLTLAGLGACFAWLGERYPFLYPGGFVVVAGLTMIMIAVITTPATRYTSDLLGCRPLRWVGLRSYGLYLWHWPVFMVTRPYLDLPLHGAPLLGLRLVLVGILVEASYRWVELPIRRGALTVLWQRWSHKATVRRAGLKPIRRLWVLLGVLLAVVGTNSAVRRDQPLRAPRPTTALSARYATSTPYPVLPPTAPAVAAAARPQPIPTATNSPAAVRTAPAVAPTPTVAAPQPIDPALIARLQSLLDATVADGFIPGAVLSVSLPGQVPWTGASGIADLRVAQAMEPDTLVHLGSITKLFTAVVVLQLVQEGKLALDAPIETWLPGIVPLANRTTVRHLLSHTSGLFDYLEDQAFFVEAYQHPDQIYTPAELVAMVSSYGAAFEPGTPGAWKYASTNYVILGMLVEQVTGHSMAQEVRQRILAPVGLTHTFFAPDDVPTGAIARGYIDESDRADVSMTFVFATGNMISTINDLRRFADALFTGQLLQPESRAMLAALAPTGGAYDMPELEYGLGVMRARLSVGPGPDGTPRPDDVVTVVGHIGGIAGFRSAVWHVPASGITIALSLNQADIDPNLLARDALELILTAQGQ